MATYARVILGYMQSGMFYLFSFFFTACHTYNAFLFDWWWTGAGGGWTVLVLISWRFYLGFFLTVISCYLLISCSSSDWDFQKCFTKGCMQVIGTGKQSFVLCLPLGKLCSSLWFSGGFDRPQEMFSFSSFCYSCLPLCSILCFFLFFLFFPYFKKLFLLSFLIDYRKIQWSSLFVLCQVPLWSLALEEVFGEKKSCLCHKDNIQYEQWTQAVLSATC